MKAVNLLPSDQRSAPASSGASPTSASGDAFGAYMVLGALVLAVVGFAAFVLAGNTIKDRKAELARVSAEASATEAKAAELAPYAEFQTLAASRVATVTGLAQSRFDWERALGDLSRAIPRNVHLKSIKGTVSSSSGGGNALRGAVQSPAIELSGCTDNQKSVAKLMSRLRAVRGVTRVSLSKSDKGGLSIAAPLAAGATDQAAVLCKGAPPSFEMVMFFERAALPAAAQPAAPAAGATQSGSGQAAGQSAPPAAPGTPAGSTGQSSTPPTNGAPAQPAPATQGVSAP